MRTLACTLVLENNIRHKQAKDNFIRTPVAYLNNLRGFEQDFGPNFFLAFHV